MFIGSERGPGPRPSRLPAFSLGCGQHSWLLVPGPTHALAPGLGPLWPRGGRTPAPPHLSCAPPWEGGRRQQRTTPVHRWTGDEDPQPKPSLQRVPQPPSPKATKPRTYISVSSHRIQVWLVVPWERRGESGPPATTRGPLPGPPEGVLGILPVRSPRLRFTGEKLRPRAAMGLAQGHLGWRGPTQCGLGQLHSLEPRSGAQPLPSPF